MEKILAPFTCLLLKHQEQQHKQRLQTFGMKSLAREWNKKIKIRGTSSKKHEREEEKYHVEDQIKRGL